MENGFALSEQRNLTSNNVCTVSLSQDERERETVKICGFADALLVGNLAPDQDTGMVWHSRRACIHVHHLLPMERRGKAHTQRSHLLPATGASSVTLLKPAKCSVLKCCSFLWISHFCCPRQKQEGERKQRPGINMA